MGTIYEDYVSFLHKSASLTTWEGKGAQKEGGIV